ncbi:NAD(P)/FAD-dependent oxidoreductase [Marinobacter lutaoensis]|jgi:cation diffusion facilitator CzcD-associated flavoprotein CzcO|uniref:FAD-containing monooxygenase EthA n=1 Tax=Marinobacter lutaoensis TaxID=135739 RepID=A0A1V2DNK0_9GAMM|nr:NAD(P)/FAD-dependent oxidoreductase [Marinobacter lutaoensis]MBE01737.1 NAD(P)/FAD-dependent oxidoreductase [Marinobacter sp.]MBI43741.1 NAD(P)/FAD-dependent oxidoreductase [Oceanospirillales bacterium]ONF42193.1 FAD-containing monooxygenase EthA [Marinobacter lutaoensis]|tara:strand:+ start:1115 stop:2641 length:1527 start_codon:yes stop_codon:yes gene_type:complete
MSQHPFDVLIIGAGVSGIGMACHLRRACPGRSFAILERRQAIGGTWDLFRYPGIRSDSDMFTFGYNFRPWTGGKVLADGAAIKQYVTDTAREHGVTRHIRFQRAVQRAEWSSADKCWTLTVRDEASGNTETYTARFLIGCTGYYNYDRGYKPDFPGEADFRGQVVHPQHWPEDLDYSGKRVVVIGSGATAVTLVPTLAEKAAHVTMLQRSPTYLMPLPSIDKVTLALQKVLPEKVAYRLTRARNISIARLLYERSRRSPKAMRRLLLAIIRRQLGGQVDMRHFSPDYNPWDQRLCVVKDGDLFQVLKSGRASIVTDRIERFTETGIRLASGTELEADLIVPATGLDLQMLGGVAVSVDGEPVVMKDKIIYKNVLVEGVPNAGMIFGYTNISWTLKVDIAAEYLCRLMNLMDRRGHQVVVARDTENSRGEETILGSLDAGYIKRAADRLPRQGTHGPWKSNQNYLEDVKVLRFEPIEDGYLEFDGVRTRVGQGRAAGVLAPLRSALFGT